MLNKLLKKLGYVKIDEMTYEFHLSQVAKLLGDPTDYKITPEIESKFFNEMSRVENVNGFLDATLAADMQREFSCTDDTQRHLVKGAFGRTLYFKRGIKKEMLTHRT